MRASLFALALLATSACTQSNVQLPAFYDGGNTTPLDSSVSDATEDAPEEAAVEAAAADAPHEAATEAGGSTEAGSEAGNEAGPSDAGDGGG